MHAFAARLALKLYRGQLPVFLLITLLQRTPVVRLFLGAESVWLGSSTGQLVRSAVLFAASLGAVDTLAGATRFTANPVSPAAATVGTPFTAVFAVTGAPSNVQAYTLTNLPPGLTLAGATVNAGTWKLIGSSGTITGTPTTAGSPVVRITAWEFSSATGNNAGYNYTINVAGGANIAPAITTQPVASQAVSVGANVTFTAAASGSPAPTYQWRKGAGNLGGATSATLTLSNVQLADADTYTVVATNSAGAATSNGAVLTVSRLAQSITFSTLPDVPYTPAPIALSASASSSLAVNFSVVSGPATVSGNQLTLTGPGAVTVRAAQAGGATYLAAPNVDRTFMVLPSFQSWQQSRFTAGELADPAVSGPNAVYGADSLTNLFKYALGLEPKADATTGLPELSSNSTDWIYTYARPASLIDVVYTVEFSTDAVNWTSAGVTHELVSSSGGIEVWRGRCPLGTAATPPPDPLYQPDPPSAARIYFRLKIVRP